MKSGIAIVLIILGVTTDCWSQDLQKKRVPPECAKTIRVHGSFPTGPFEILPNESYKRSPIIHYEIHEDGTVSNAAVTRTSGVADIDRKLLDAFSRWKFKPRPAGCGVIETAAAC
jgi:TonB family protein